jgi:hypothetical protein
LVNYDLKSVTVDQRPYTVPPADHAVVEIDSGRLLEMDNQEITSWLHVSLGIWIDPGLPREKFLQEVMRQAELLF